MSRERWCLFLCSTWIHSFFRAFSFTLARFIVVLTLFHSFHTFLRGSSPFHPGSVCLRPSSLRIILLLFSHLHSAPLCAFCSLSGCHLLFHFTFSHLAISPFSLPLPFLKSVELLNNVLLNGMRNYLMEFFWPIFLKTHFALHTLLEKICHCILQKVIF